MIIHVCAPETGVGSRVNFQKSVVINSKVICVKKKAFFDPEVSRALKDGAPKCLVFHQPWTLPMLITVRFFQLVRFYKPHTIVYDMHDFVEFSKGMRLKNRVNTFVCMILEWLVVRSGVVVITVSDGLSNLCQKRYGRNCKVVYNHSPIVSADCSEIDSDCNKHKCTSKCKIVYFGQLKPDRLPIPIVRALVDVGYKMDIYGYFPSNVDGTFAAELLTLIERGGGKFKGKYDPTDLNFLDDYCYSFMAFMSSRKNIRFCMPNKLFQSLSRSIVCLVDNNMVESISAFIDTGYVVNFNSFLNRSSVHDSLNKTLLEHRLKAMECRSISNFRSATELAPN